MFTDKYIFLLECNQEEDLASSSAKAVLISALLEIYSFGLSKG